MWGDRHESAALRGSNGSPIGWPRLSDDGTKIVAAGLEWTSTGMLYGFLMPPGDLLGYSTIVGAPAFAMSSSGSVLVAGAPGTTIGTQAHQGAAHLFLTEPGVAAALFGGVSLPGALGTRGHRVKPVAEGGRQCRTSASVPPRHRARRPEVSKPHGY